MSAGVSFSSLFGFKDGERIERLKTPEAFRGRDVGGLLVVKMGRSVDATMMAFFLMCVPMLGQVF